MAIFIKYVFKIILKMHSPYYSLELIKYSYVKGTTYTMYLNHSVKSFISRICRVEENLLKLFAI